MRKKMKKQAKKKGKMYPGMGYPGSGGYPSQPMYPQGVVPPPSSGYPGSVPTGYPPQSGTGYPPQPGYPPQGTYPPQPQYPHSGGYPPQQPGYPASQPGYPPSQPAYPTSQPGYPPQSQPGYPPQSGYPQGDQMQRPPYQAQPGYPAQSPNMPPAYSAQPAYPYPNAAPTGYPPQSGYPYPSDYAPQTTATGETYPTSTPTSVPTPAPAQAPPTVLSDSLKHMTIYGGAELFHPTVKPVDPFSAESDAAALRKAMKGFGTDEATIVSILSRRSNKQRQEIALMFKTMYGKDIIDDLKSELSGHLEEVIMALFKPPAYYDAWSINNAISGLGTKESILVEILCTRTNSEIHEIVSNYKQHYGKDLEKDIMSDTSGHFKRLLVSCLQGNRNELTPEQVERVIKEGPGSVVNLDQARDDAQRLYQAGAKKIGTDESTILSVLAIRNYYQMKATFDEYARISGKDIIDSIKSETSGDLETGFKALITCSRNRPEFFANCLHKALSGLGTKDHTLIRVIVSRCEIDLQSIKAAYQHMYGKSLAHAVSSDTSGDYKKLLLGLLGE